MARRRWIFLTLVVAVFAVFLALRRTFGLEFEPGSLRDAMGALGVWAPLAYVGIVAFRVPLGLPSQLVLLAGGLLFGTAAGTLYGAAGLVISAGVLFSAARWAGRDAVVARVPGRLRYLLDVASSRLGAAFIAVGTGYPLGPITLYHLIAGVTRMALPVFLVAVTLGSLVRAVVFTYFGSSLVSGELDRLVLATGALLLVALLPLAFARSRSWLLQAVSRRSEPGGASEPV